MVDEVLKPVSLQDGCEPRVELFRLSDRRRDPLWDGQQLASEVGDALT